MTRHVHKDFLVASGLPSKVDRKNIFAMLKSLATSPGSILGSLVMVGFMQAGSAIAERSPEAEMGQALMRMREAAQPPEAGAVAPAAGEGWYTCVLDMVGPGWGNIYLHLGCGTAISPRWFAARADQARDMLAAGLTAISINKQIIVYLSGSAEYSEIRASYIVK